MAAPIERKFSSYTPAERRELYETDPARFDELAAAAIRDACVGRTEEQTLKLRRMQWVIEGRLRKHKSPQQKLQEMQRIFYDGLYGSDGLILRLNSACTSLARTITRADGIPSREPTLRMVTLHGKGSPPRSEC